MINTYDLAVFFDGYSREYHNISIVAVKRYITYHRDTNSDYKGAVYMIRWQVTDIPRGDEKSNSKREKSRPEGLTNTGIRGNIRI
jgi:hypothetical protein